MSRPSPTISFGLDVNEIQENRWLWHGVLAPGKVTLLTSLWKSGKTTLLAHLLACRRSPNPSETGRAETSPADAFLDLAVARGTSLIISEEPADLWAERRRRHRLGAELGVLTRPFAGRPSFAELRQLAGQILDLKRERGLDLVVFDSLAMFLPARNENSADAMVDALGPFVALAEADLAVWLLHHPSKGEPALGQAARGSGALLASVDIFLEMRHPGGNPFTRRRKIFGWSRYQETPRQMLIELSSDGLTYQRLVDAGDDFHANWDTVHLILAAATNGGLTRSAIREAWPPGAAKPHDATLWRWLDRAVELGIAARIGKGTKTEPYRYVLPPATAGASA
jgi:AAA domain